MYCRAICSVAPVTHVMLMFQIATQKSYKIATQKGFGDRPPDHEQGRALDTKDSRPVCCDSHVLHNRQE